MVALPRVVIERVADGAEISESPPRCFWGVAGLVEDVAGVKRNFVALEECEIFFLEGFGSMMFTLILNVGNDFSNPRIAHRKCSVAILPAKVSELWKLIVNPG